MEHHHHTHNHEITHLNRAFIIGIVLNLLFVVLEFGLGFYFNSLALLSDAGHNLSDVISLALALLAFQLAKIKPNKHYTYGLKKSTILVSLTNAVILLVAVGGIISESIQKIQHPTPVLGGVIAWVAGVGIFINGLTAFLFFKEQHHDLNAKGAYLHLMADALVSLGVVISGLVISYTAWYQLDAMVGLVIALVILLSTWNLLKDSVKLSLDGVPSAIDLEKVKSEILADPFVQGVHHLHIWAISTTQNALTAHIVVNDNADLYKLKHTIKHQLEHLGIQHATLEIEQVGEDCSVNC